MTKNLNLMRMKARIKMSQNSNNKKYPDVIKFIRQKDFLFKKELGKGSCGETILIFDETMGEEFVCKKYSPCSEEFREEFYSRFCKEIKILYKLNHRNIVRIFNYYLYPSTQIGYILMEYIKGDSILNYLKKHPEQVNSIFEQVIDAFAYLENNKVLHRDIRPNNIMVTEDGCVKVIDFGFSKNLDSTEMYSKSISLNWWCTTPNEFDNNIYNFQTEIYFIGKLFEKIITENNIDFFAYRDCLKHMIYKAPQERIASFKYIKQAMKDNLYEQMSFSETEKETYTSFANDLSNAIVKIPYSTTYETDIDKIVRELEDVYRKNMLENFILNNNKVISCFCNGNFVYKTHKDIFVVQALKEFTDYIKSCSKDKQNIILSNLHSRLDAIDHYDDNVDDEVPF